MLTMIRASLELMDEVRECINSNYDLYKDIVEEKDLSEHMVSQEWAERNFKIREFYLARKDGKYVGATSYQNLNDKLAYVGYFYIKRQHQGKGLGSAMMNFVQMRTLKDDLDQLYLFAQPDAHWAGAFYHKLGFKIASSDKEQILDIENGVFEPFYEENCLLMHKTLENGKEA